jgi:hypothetical protein
MKRSVRIAALILIAAAGCAAQTFTGVVHSNQCVGPACATQCPINKEPVYTLQTEDRAWVLSDAKTAARVVGKKVTITGTAKASTIEIKSITPAE